MCARHQKASSRMHTSHASSRQLCPISTSCGTPFCDYEDGGICQDATALDETKKKFPGLEEPVIVRAIEYSHRQIFNCPLVHRHHRFTTGWDWTDFNYYSSPFNGDQAFASSITGTLHLPFSPG